MWRYILRNCTDTAEHRTEQIKAAGFGVVASYRAQKQQYEFVIAYPEKEEGMGTCIIISVPVRRKE